MNEIKLPVSVRPDPKRPPAVLDADGGPICICVRKEHARRIAAALNACAGIATERLEDEAKDAIWS